MRTPYFHLFHDDGTPYMARFWLLRIGECAPDDEGKVYPWLGIRVHHIQSSDDRVPHDHPWTFVTWILRGGYTEVKPQRWVGGLPGGYSRHRTYRAGSIRMVRAKQFHYLLLDQGVDAWTLFFTFRKVQGWGFLVNGVKVPWCEYLKQRAAERPVVRQRDL
jgi:hypothetical protein